MSAKEKEKNGLDFIAKFSSHKLEPFYYLYGTDNYLKEKITTLIEHKVIKPEGRDFDLSIFYGDDADISAVIDSLLGHPFFSDKKLIIIRKFDNMKAEEQQKVISAIMTYKIDNIVVLTAETFDSRKKASKQISDLATVIHCRSPYKGEDMIPWLSAEVKGAGKNMDRQAELMFVQNIELDYLAASNELEKLFLFCKDVTRITVKEVQASIRSARSVSIFDLVETVGNRDIKKSLHLAEKVVDSKESAIQIISILLRFFVQLWRINALRGKGYSSSDITARYLNEVFYSRRNDYVRYAQNYSIKALEQVFLILLEADADFKSINLDDKLLIERMLYRIIKV